MGSEFYTPDSYYVGRYGLVLPKNMKLKPSGNKAAGINETGYTNALHGITLDQYVKAQLMQSRSKYFLLMELYRRDTWIRATVDYIVRRLTRDDNRLIDEADPMNPDITDLKEWLEDSFPDGDFTDVYGGIAQDLLIYGQAYVYIERAADGTPLHLWPMDSRICYPVVDFSGAILFHAQVYNGQAQFFTEDEVLYFPLRNNGANPKAVPSMETLYESVTMELQANRYNAALFENNLNIGAVFSMPNADADAVEENRRYLIDQYSGPENAYLPLLLSGDAKMLRDGAMAVKDINFELLIRVARHRVSAVFGVPEALLGIPDNTNKATANTHERTTYTNTIRPMRKRINRRFTHCFIRKVWGSKSVCLDEPLNSMLPTTEEIEAVNKIAENGIMFNDYLEMTGRPRVPNGDYWVYRTPNGLVRLDTTAMPGLGDPHFDFVAYQNEHDAQQQTAQDMTMAGMQPQASSTPYIPPRPQDLIQLEPIAARIIDMSRAMSGEPEGSWVVSRRIPMNPGSRGGATLYTTKTGKSRYGTPPKGKQAPLESADGSPNENTLLNPKDISMPERLSPEERQAVQAARAVVSDVFRQSQQENWTNQQFFDALTEQGWQVAQDTQSQFTDASDARAEARRLSEAYPQNVYTLIGADGQYMLMEKELGSADDHIQSAPSAKYGPNAGTGNPNAMKREKQDTGNPSARPKAKQDSGNPMGKTHEDRGNGPVKRSMSSNLSDWAAQVRKFTG